MTPVRPSVWAPDRTRVRLRANGLDVELTKDESGWWHGPDPLQPGTDYAFLLDEDDTPLPDPRSRWQPDGVHGPSRVYDHSAYAWTDRAWTGRALPGAVIY
ncbi:MAG TPA: malto-oligosyltrehalose trehalohydrolase, partial [Streptosporangiaceae bacterium]